MQQLLELREAFKRIYSKYDIYINPGLKFILSLTVLIIIRAGLGSANFLGNMGLILIISLICTFIPQKAIVYLLAFYTAATVYFISIEFFVIVVFIMVIIALLYMQFSPEHSYLIVLTAASGVFGVSLIPALLSGIFIGPAALVPAACGSLIYSVLSFVSENSDKVNTAGTGNVVDRFKYIIDNLSHDKDIYINIVAVLIVITAVFVIRRLKIKYVWIMAAAAGTVLDLLILIIGAVLMDTNASLINIIIGVAVSFIVCLIVLFFGRNFDYTRTERVQFEDEEYYYYVKAVPKRSVEKKTKAARHYLEDEN